MKRVAWIAAAVLCTAGTCQPTVLSSKQVSTVGGARSPRIAWNGTHYGILYLREGAGLGYHVELFLVDPKGAQVRFDSPQWVNTISPADDEFLISDLVWNAADGQFAFAYARDGVVWLATLGKELQTLRYTKIAFASPVPPAPKLVDLSLVWNPVRHHYALAAVSREDPYATDRHDDVYLSFVRPDGSFSNPQGTASGQALYHTVNCPGDCKRTALAVSTDGSYRLAYFKFDGANAQPTLGWVDEGLGFGQQGGVREQPVLSPSYGAVFGAGLRLLADPAADEVLVGLSRNAASIAPGGLWLQGASRGTLQAALSAGGVHDPQFSLAGFLGSHSYMVCFGDGQVRCRLTSNTTLETKDFVTPASGAGPQHSPHHTMGPNGPVLVWIEGGNLFFGPVY